jgi:membrane protease YdiL (CAAX protease family)
VVAALRGVGPVGIAVVLAVLVVAWFYGPMIAGALILIWALVTRSWRDLGFVRPESWLSTIVGGVLIGIVSKLVMKAVVMPLLGFPDHNPRYDYLIHNTAALPGMIFLMIVSAGLGEELICRGFLFERLGRILGTSRNAKIAIVIVTSVLFAAAHYPEQQWMGVTNALIMALIVGTYFAIKRNLWTLIVWHAAFDICALFMTYFDLNTKIAHAIFR